MSGGQVTDISYELSGVFEAEHPQNMVDACDAYVLTGYRPCGVWRTAG